MRAFWAIAHNEMAQLYRDMWYLFLLTIGGMASLIIMAYTMSADIERVETLMVDLDQSRESRRFIQALQNDTFFALNFMAGRRAAEQHLQEGTARVVIIIPADYGQRLNRGETVQVQALIDGSIPNIAEPARAHLSALTRRLAQDVLVEQLTRQGMAAAASPAFQPRVRYNAALKTIVSVIPGMMGIVLSISAVGAASALGRERERGTFEMLICTPLGRWPLLLGRVCPYVLIGLLDVILFAAIGHFIFNMPLRGNLVLFVLLSCAYLFAITSTGVLIAQFVQTQHAAMIITFMLFGIAPAYLSDIFFPVFTMPAWLQQESALMPATHFTAIARGIFLKGVGWQALWPNTLALLLTGMVMSTLAYLRFQKKLG
ncbi:MAG: ABC transporter permease [Anaerolineae bacterium]|nr:ABC transporter permease [Anaerolineae bacterium]